MRRLIALGLLCASTWNWATSPETVKNGKTPREKPIQFHAEPDLVMAPKDDVPLWVGQAVILAVNSKGQMLISDPSENSILMYGQDGSLIRKVGTTGQGPGEFQALAAVHVLADDSVIALDLAGSIGKLVYFDESLNYLDQKTPLGFGTMIQTFVPSPDGNLLGALYVEIDMNTQKMSICSGLLTPDFERVRVITSAERSVPNVQRFGDPSYWSEYLGENMALVQKTGYVAYTPSGRVLTAISDAYRVTLLSKDGKRVEKVVERDYEPIPNPSEEVEAMVDPIKETTIEALPTQFKSLITDQVIERAVELAQFPKVKPPIFNLISLPDEGFLVIHDMSLLEHRSRADVFSADGIYRGHFTLPHLPMGGAQVTPRWIFKPNYLYVLDRNENDENELVRYTWSMD